MYWSAHSHTSRGPSPGPSICHHDAAATPGTVAAAVTDRARSRVPASAAGTAPDGGRQIPQRCATAPLRGSAHWSSWPGDVEQTFMYGPVNGALLVIVAQLAR